MNNQFDEQTKNPSRPTSPRRQLKKFWLVLASVILAWFALANKTQIQRSQIEGRGARATPPTVTETEAINTLNRKMLIDNMIQNGTTLQTANTLNLMNAMSGRGASWSTR